MSSVLAKLMGIDKPSASRTTHHRHRVFSEDYLQNVASVAKRERSLPYSDDDDGNMDVRVDAARCLGASVIEHQNFLCQNGKSTLYGRSFSPSNSLSDDHKLRKYVSKPNNGMHIQERRTSSSNNSVNSPIQGSLSSRETAKQITGLVKHSIWHSCAGSSRSRSTSKKSYDNKEVEKMTASVCLFDPWKRYEASPFNTVNGCPGRESQKAKKQLSERWRTGKSLQQVNILCGSEPQYKPLGAGSNGRNSVSRTSNCNFSTPVNTDNMNGWPVLAARYLSKPALFPSAWVPRSRARQFTIDRNWRLRPGNSISKQCSDSKEDISRHKAVRSTSESSICGLDSEKPCIYRATSLITSDSVELSKQSSNDEIFSASESLSIRSPLSDVESPAFHEAHATLNEIGSGDLENDVSQDNTFGSLSLHCNLAPLSMKTEFVVDEETEKMNMATKFRREDLAKSTTCILVGDRESWKHQLKNTSVASEPGSPVSSLEGPESCRHVLNFPAEAEKHLPVSDCLDNETHGLQRKLLLIETMSLESGSEGPEMAVSGDEGDDGAYVGFYQKDPQIMENYQTFIKECCDFSYVVDVVGESGLQMRNLEMEGKTWWLRGYVLDPLVFDLLEKKYGKHVPSERSERKLLFDRLNLGLLEIVKPSAGLNAWRKPVVERFCLRQKSQELIEELLWSLLMNQRVELKREISKPERSDKVCKTEMEWLELEEDTDLIVQEIQNLLIDELIEEFVCLETSFC